MSKLLWEPSGDQVKQTNLYRFMNIVNEEYTRDFNDYASLYKWSIDHIADFWETMWGFADIIASEPYQQVIDDASKMPGAKWFSGIKLNFAENLLRHRDDKIAIIFKGEGKESIRLTYSELNKEVARLAKSLRESGVSIGDRVVGFMPNMPESIIAMLAARSGQKIQVETILVRAFISVTDPEKRFHPMMAPTIACEVETGKRARVIR